MKTALLHLCTIALAIVLWPFAITGLLSYLVSGMRFNRWYSSGSSLCLAIVWRVASGHWLIYVGEEISYSWYFELFFGMISWVISAIFVSAFAQSIVKFLEGWRAKVSSRA